MNNDSVFTRSTIKKASAVLCPPEGAAYLVAEHRRLVCLVRHGQTDWNVTRRLQGRESVPLNDTGRNQALECGKILAEAVRSGFEIGGFFTSPLIRAVESASIVTSTLGMPDAETEELLNERDYGALSGLTLEERRERYANGFSDPAVESVKDTSARMKEAIASLTARCPKGAVAAVTHGGLINAFFVTVTCGRIGTGKSISENCSVSLVAAGADATIPLAYGLTGEDFLAYAASYTGKLRELTNKK